jgi:hypothetical protein
LLGGVVAEFASPLPLGPVFAGGTSPRVVEPEDPEPLSVTRVVLLLELEELDRLLETLEPVPDLVELVDVLVAVIIGEAVDATAPLVTMTKLSRKKVLASLRFVMTRVCWALRTIGDA